MTYNAEKIIGNGSFGVVFKATIAETGETVALATILTMVKKLNDQ